MDLITLDFETYYDSEYSLSKMTTEAYVRGSKFEAIMCAIKVGNTPAYWLGKNEIADGLKALNLESNCVICHHSHFDCLILSHWYGIIPGRIVDTLAMGRNLHGSNSRLSLKKLSELYGIGVKGDEVHNVKGMRYADFSREELNRYGDYCLQDVNLTYALARLMLPQFEKSELQLIDYITRMFTEPVFVLDEDILTEYANSIRLNKEKVLRESGVTLDELMSNEKFANILTSMGVDPPMKISPSWLKKNAEDRDERKKMTFAFSKTDEGLQKLQEHPDERVQILVEARLQNKTTLAEKSSERMIAMNRRGAATVYLKYSGASATHRLSGGDSLNWQSFKRGSLTRESVKAPVGHKIVVGDSSNIDARVLNWISCQEDVMQIFRDADAGVGPDVYCVMAERIYKRKVNKKDNPSERQFGKTAELGLGYGTGADRFMLEVQGKSKDDNGRPKIITREFAKEVVDIYRSTHAQVINFWSRCKDALKYIRDGVEGVPVDKRGLIVTCRDGLLMPDGLKIKLHDLKYEINKANAFGGEWSFWNGKARERIHGAALTGLIVQCLARIIVMGQCRLAANDFRNTEGEVIAKWAHSVHDEGVFVTPDFYAPYVLERLIYHMRTPPKWAGSLPLNSEGGFHQSYGKAKS